MQLDHMSWSQDNTFEKCPQQYFFRYGEKLKRPPGVGQVRGQGPHHSVEADLTAKMQTGRLLEKEVVGEIAADHVTKAFRGEISIDGEFEGMKPSEALTVARDDARKMALYHHEHLAPAIQPTELEVRIRAQFPDYPIPYVGVIDLIDSDTAVQDLKTKRKAPEAAFAHSSGQLTVYWGLFSALKNRAPTELSFAVVWVTPGGKTNAKPMATTRDEHDFAARLRRSRTILKAIEAEIFVPTSESNWACSPRWCGYTDICPYFRGRPRPTS